MTGLRWARRFALQFVPSSFLHIEGIPTGRAFQGSASAPVGFATKPFQSLTRASSAAFCGQKIPDTYSSWQFGEPAEFCQDGVIDWDAGAVLEWAAA
jgi:hypothetical protein